LSDKIGLLPRVTMGKSVEDFFDRLEEKAANGTDFVTWYGELYFELHRGTYTTQANNKWNNRKCEILMHDIEYLATLATIKNKNYKYPKEDLDDCWENILLCQFHDCLPGSSIEMCYDDSDELYAKVFKTGNLLMDHAFKALKYKEYDGQGQPLALNLLPWSRTEIVSSPDNKRQAVVTGSTGPLSLSSPSAQSTVTIDEKRKGVFVLASADYQLQVEGGAITSLLDKRAQRQVIPAGKKANQLVIFDDKPLYWQAWDVEVFHLESRKELPAGETKLGTSSPSMVSVVTETKISEKSWIKTTISITASVADSPSLITMDSEVEWREDKKFLKVEFPVDVYNTEASYETQYGIIKRPTHYNTSWDMAKFEVCCHKWADLSENGYGVSILNDSKYGFATCGSMMRLSLLRAPKAPDAHADMGRHRIKYAMMPHQGGVDHRTVRAAYAFNHPMKLISPLADSSSDDKAIFSMLGLKGDPALLLDCIKRGEDDEDVSRGELPYRRGKSIILRVYESLGGRARGIIFWDTDILDVKAVTETNLLEDDGEHIEAKNGMAKIELRPFEVATYRLQL